MLDTVAVAEAVLRREPPATLRRYGHGLGGPKDIALRFLAFAAGVHDLGKATPAFQARWEPGRQCLETIGFCFHPLQDPPPHGALTAGLLKPWLERKGLSFSVSRVVAWAVAAHHGFLPLRREVVRVQDPRVVGDEMWRNARDALLDCLWEVLGMDECLPFLVGRDSLEDALTVALMALASFADWIASDPEHFPYGRDARDPAGYLEEARRLADRALDAIGWHRRTPLTDRPPPFESVFPFMPNNLQETVLQAIGTAEAPALLMIEAPMGSGKTEAALYAHLFLQARGGHRGLYIAMPTMATGNAIFDRCLHFLKKFTIRTLDLQLQHGTAILHEEFRRLRPARVGEDEAAQKGESGVLAAEWFTQRKRAMLSEYGVGTIDQALLGVLRVRHHFVRLFGLANRTVVLDEVHAYDTYTSGLIERLIAWLKTLGSSVVLMSATLPTESRRRLLQAYGAQVPEADVPYPRVTVVREGLIRSLPVTAGTPKVIELGSAPQDIPGLAGFVRALVDQSPQAGCIACILNTVDRAQCLYVALGPGEPIRQENVTVGKRLGDWEVYLFHARYPSDERECREELVRKLFGKGGRRPKKAIVVATQVLEQSLDVDFDVLVTDLAPIDLILQRAGRLHRFDLPRPAVHDRPRCYVVGGTADPSDWPDEWKLIYFPYVLLRTWAVLRGRSSVSVPHDLQAIIDAVYSETELSVPDSLGPVLREFKRNYDDEQERMKAWAQGNAVRVGQLLELGSDVLSVLEPEDDEDQDSQVPLTRYGEPSIGVVPCYRTDEALYLDPGGRHPVDPQTLPDWEDAVRIFRRSVRLSGRRVYAVLRELQPPTGWRRHPLLRRLRLLELSESYECCLHTRGDEPPLTIRWDPELGIVYEGCPHTRGDEPT